MGFPSSGSAAWPRRQVLAAMATSPLWLSGAAASAQLDAAATVRALSEETRRSYHDADVGAAVADRLMAALAEGRFAAAASDDALAQAINAEIRSASGDGHFMLMPGSMHAQPVPSTPAHRPVPPLNPDELAYLRRVNFGLAAAELLPGNVARLDIRQLYRPAPEVRQRLAEAMAFLADSWAFILDLSRNIGGDPHAVALVISYFFERPSFVVNRFRWRSLPVEEFRTTERPGGPLYGEARPLVVLVSGSTFSAAEELAYDVQALRRGTVVGETTGGGANHALPMPIAGGFTAFIPQARAENPLTGTNWERVGVRPDVAVAGEVAAIAAHRSALEGVVAAGDADKARIAREALARLA